MPLTDEGRQRAAQRVAERMQNARDLHRSADRGDPLKGVRVECRFDVNSVTINRYGYEDVNLTPVYDPTGENGSFAQATPSGEIRLSVSNPKVIGTFQPGQHYRVILEPLG